LRLNRSFDEALDFHFCSPFPFWEGGGDAGAAKKILLFSFALEKGASTVPSSKANGLLLTLV
jgi:hypothetical protein